MSNPLEPGKPTFLPYASAMRFFAVLAVILLHSSANATAQCGELSMKVWQIAVSIDSSVRWCVPVFIMLSGALLLDPARQDSLSHFFKKRFMRILIPLIFWSAFYFMWFHFFRGDAFSWNYVRDQILVGMTDTHLYFLYIILGLYFSTPFLRAYVREASHRDISALTAIFFMINSVSLLANNVSFNAFTRFYPYISYFLAGYLLRAWKPEKKIYVTAACIFLSITVYIAVKANHLCLSGQKDKIELYFEHFFPAIILQSLSAFILLRLLAFGRKPPAWIEELGNSSFGIYLVHIAVLDWIRQYSLRFYFSHIIATTFAEVSIVAAISIVLIMVIRRIPGVRYVVG